MCIAVLIIIGCADVTLPSDALVEGIHVSGTGSVTASPDIARVRIGVQTFHKDAGQAVAENNDNSAKIVEAIRREGIEDRDLQTSSFTISERRDYRIEGPDQLLGFQVRNTLSVTIRDLTRVGIIIQAALDEGANSVFGVEFAIEDPAELMRQARSKAVEDAQARAETVAESAGVTVGPPVRIVETTPGVIVPRGTLNEAAADRTVPIEPGELEISVSVAIVFEIT
jgi:hypothetical protein